MRKLLLCLLGGFVGIAHADDLAVAKDAFNSKDYPVALALFTRLADGGNAEAQRRLGEMYWYGEGATTDRSKADALFTTAAAAGNQEAADDLNLTPSRRQKVADISYWTQGYNGAELTSGQYACKLPSMPPRPSTDAEITRLQKSLKAWQICYSGVISYLDESMPAGKRIPADVAMVMSDAELQQSRRHLEMIYKKVVDQIRTDAVGSTGTLDQWRLAAEKTIEAHTSSRREWLDLMSQLRFSGRAFAK